MAIIPYSGKFRNKIESLWRVCDAAWFGRDVSTFEQAPDALNGEFLLGVNAAGTGTVNMIGVNASNQVVLPNGALTPSGSVGLSATVNLSAAQIITLHSVPVPLIAAPGVGLALVVDQLVFEITTTATQFTGGGVVAPVYHGATTAITGNTIPATVVTAVAGTTSTLLALGSVANGLTLTSNTGVDLFAAVADFAVGTGTAKVIVYYKIITL
jgi:hypothetical protein